MLKKVSLTALTAVILSAVSLSSYAAVSVTGSVAAEADLVSKTKADTVNNGKETNAFTLPRFEGYFYLKVSQALTNGWAVTGQFGFENLGRPNTTIASEIRNNGKGPYSLGADSNYFIAFSNAAVEIKAGDTRYLADVANFNYYEAAGAISDYSLIDNTDQSQRNGALAVSLKSVPNLTLKAGFGSFSQEKLATVAPATTAEIKKDSYSQVGAVASYAIAGAQFGVQFVQQDQKLESVGTELKTTSIVAGASYSLAEVANVPLNFWLSMLQKEVKSQIDVVALQSYTTFDLGVGYTFGSGDVGLTYDNYKTEKEGVSYLFSNGTATYGAKDSANYDKGLEGENIILWVNYNIGPSTLAYASYSIDNYNYATKGNNSYSATGGSVGNATNKVEGKFEKQALLVGVKQSF